MDIYHYAAPSQISHVEFIQDAKQVWLARIFPQPGADPARLASLTATLNRDSDGVIAVPHTEQGVHTLYASGFDKPEALLGKLARLNYVGTQHSVEHVTKEGEAFTSRMRDASLKAAGVFYLISDAAIAASGLKSGRYKETVAGLLYSSGGIVLAKYGRKDAHTHLKDLSLRLGNFFEQENIPIPQDGPIMGANQERRSQIVEGLEKFAYTYPSQIFNSIVAVCGVQLMQSGITHKKSWDTTAGSLVLAGALAGLLIPEKSNKRALEREGEEKKPANLFSKVYSWAQDRPLKIPGYLWFGNNIAFTFSALRERQMNPEQKSYMYKFGYVATAMIANGLMSISSKGDNKNFDMHSDCVQAMFAVAANTIAAQPKPAQEHMIQQVAGFIASQKEINIPAKELAVQIRAQVDELAQNPFARLEIAQPSPAEQAEIAGRYTANAVPRDNWHGSVRTAENVAAVGF